MCCWRMPRLVVIIITTAAAAAMWFACELIGHFPGIHFSVSQIGWHAIEPHSTARAMLVATDDCIDSRFRMRQLTAKFGHARVQYHSPVRGQQTSRTRRIIQLNRMDRLKSIFVHLFVHHENRKEDLCRKSKVHAGAVFVCLFHSQFWKCLLIPTGFRTTKKLNKLKIDKRMWPSTLQTTRNKRKTEQKLKRKSDRFLSDIERYAANYNNKSMTSDERIACK